jgi:hypothetical protein
MGEEQVVYLCLETCRNFSEYSIGKGKLTLQFS